MSISLTTDHHIPVVALPTTRDAAALGDTLYRYHRQRVYGICLRLSGGDVAWAEDAMQDVFVKLLNKVSELEQHDDLGGWIYRVTVNTCLSKLRRQSSFRRKVALILAHDRQIDHRTPEHQVQLQHDLTAALTELKALPAKERVVFCMKHLDGLPQVEIANTLSLSEGYVSKLLTRAEQKLRERGWEVSNV
ncbi:MAG: sigma-70 family RNA polymerase sigma factor [Deltaproteobacteria bacterium]|nr:sigma-70 family RNA polymerase sigma factor [Deltaproteobacteria bacterium]